MSANSRGMNSPLNEFIDEFKEYRLEVEGLLNPNIVLVIDRYGWKSTGLKDQNTKQDIYKMNKSEPPKLFIKVKNMKDENGRMVKIPLTALDLLNMIAKAKDNDGFKALKKLDAAEWKKRQNDIESLLK